MMQACHPLQDFDYLSDSQQESKRAQHTPNNLGGPLLQAEGRALCSFSLNPPCLCKSSNNFKSKIEPGQPYSETRSAS